MALTVEDGTGLAAADSYITAAEADTYHASIGNSGWTGSPTQKERALRRAAAAMDRLWGREFVGYRGSQEQGLDWPRTGAVDDDGYLIESTTVPQAVKDAQAELAMRLLCEDEAPDISGKDAGVLSRTTTAGRVSVSESRGAAFTGAPRFPKVEQMLERVLGGPCLGPT